MTARGLSGGRFRPAEQAARVAAKPGTRILIVDDEADLLDMLTVYLLESRYEVTTATNGVDALTAIAQQRPDVVLLDIQMPKMDGVQTLKAIMKIDQSIAVIMVTGTLDLSVTVEAIRNGAFAYIPKPFNFCYLDHLIAASLGSRTSHR